jgi:hypothetical protein
MIEDNVGFVSRLLMEDAEGDATAQHALAGTLPDAPTMGAVSVIAIVANLVVTGLLYRYRNGDSNMVSVWSARETT